MSSIPNLDRSSFPWKWIVVGVVAIAIAVAWFLLPAEAWIKTLIQWVQSAGVWGGLVFALIYIVATVLMLPASPLSIAAGLAFGLVWGFVLVSLSATAGAASAFLVARYLARDQVARMIKQRPRFNAVDQAISEGGWKIVVLLRLSPLVPFNLQNYFYGLTGIRFWHYAAATFFGILPGVLLYVYLGAAGKVAISSGAGGTAHWVVFAAGLIATVIVTVMVTKRARAKLRKIGVEQAS
jgi:uncharacterized membrane protein YdjX (TVP38/TMEM64 family)